MTRQRFNSMDMYHTVVAIEEAVDALPCHGLHDDGGEAYDELKKFLQTERESLVVRAARTEYQLRRRARIQAEGKSSG